MKVYCFGNKLVPEDTMALVLADEMSIAGVEFVKVFDPYDIYEELKEDIVIMDVVEGIEDVVLIDDVSELKATKLVSLHDFDLGFLLKLLKEIDSVGKVKIIGLPMKVDKDNIKEKIKELLMKI